MIAEACFKRLTSHERVFLMVSMRSIHFPLLDLKHVGPLTSINKFSREADYRYMILEIFSTKYVWFCKGFLYKGSNNHFCLPKLISIGTISISLGIFRSFSCLEIIPFLIYTSKPPLFDETSNLIGCPKPFLMNWPLWNDISSFVSATISMSTLLLIISEKPSNLFRIEFILIYRIIIFLGYFNLSLFIFSRQSASVSGRLSPRYVGRYRSNTLQFQKTQICFWKHITISENTIQNLKTQFKIWKHIYISENTLQFLKTHYNFWKHIKISENTLQFLKTHYNFRKHK